MFDLRHLEHSTIIYEARRPLLRLAWNGMDPNYIATLAMDVTEARVPTKFSFLCNLYCINMKLVSTLNKVIILDVRVPCTPVAKLSNHRAAGKILSFFEFLCYFIDSKRGCMGTTFFVSCVYCW